MFLYTNHLDYFLFFHRMKCLILQTVNRVIKMKINYKVYDYRIKADMTLRELEDKSGVSRATINNIENGIGNPTVEIICQLAVALKCSPYDLFYME